MLQGLAQFCIAFLEFFKQPDILDCDHSLVREGLEKCYLLVRERTHLRATDHDRSNRNTLTHKRDGQPGPETQALDYLPRIRRVVLIVALGHDVVNMDCLPVENGSTDHQTSADWSGLANRQHGGNNPVVRHLPHHVALNAMNLSINGLA